MKNKKIIIIICAIAIVLLVIGISSIFLLKNNKISDNDKSKKTPDADIITNNYTVDRSDPYKDVKSITSDTLKKEHCLNQICIKDLIIYKDTDIDSVVLYISNKGDDTATGSMALDFSEETLFVAYKNLKKGKDAKYTVQLEEPTLNNVVDFTVRELTAQEKSKFRIE